MTSTCANLREDASDEQVIELEKKMKRFNLNVGKLTNTSGRKFRPRKRTNKRIQDKQIRFDSGNNPTKNSVVTFSSQRSFFCDFKFFF